MSVYRPRTKSGVTLARLPPKPPIGAVLTPKDDPFIASSKGPSKTVRLRACCPGKRIVFSAGKAMHSKGPVPVLGFPLALLSPRTTPVSPRQQYPNNDEWRLGPVKVRRKPTVHLKRSESMGELSRGSVQTPVFRKGTMTKEAFKQMPSLAANVGMWKKSVLQLADPEVSFGH